MVSIHHGWRPGPFIFAELLSAERRFASFDEAHHAFARVFAREDWRKLLLQMLRCRGDASRDRDAGVGERRLHTERRLLRDELRDRAGAIDVGSLRHDLLYEADP